MDERRERKGRGEVNPDDYYAVLGVSRSATKAEIKKAFRKLANELHPDKTKGNRALEERFKGVKDAYETLMDDARRATYDSGGKGAVREQERRENGAREAEARREGFMNWANAWFDGKEGDSLRGRIIFGLRSGESLSAVKRRVDSQLDVYLNLIPPSEHEEWRRKQEDIMRQVEREYHQRGRGGYERRDSGTERSTERKRREFREWYNAWMNIGNPNGLYQEVRHRFQNRQSFREVQQWARDEIERKCREGGEPDVAFYRANVDQVLEQARNVQAERERKEREFKTWFDAWINTQGDNGLFQETLKKLRRGVDEDEIERLARAELAKRIREANIAPRTRDHYFAQMLRMLGSAFALHDEEVRQRKAAEERRENRKRELDAWVKSVGTWAYGEMKNNVPYAAVLGKAEEAVRGSIQQEEGLERYLQAVRDELVRAWETLEQEKRAQEERAKQERRARKEPSPEFISWFQGMKGRVEQQVRVSHQQELTLEEALEVQRAILAAQMNRQEVPQEGRQKYIDELEASVREAYVKIQQEKRSAEAEKKRGEFEGFFYPYLARLPGNCIKWLEQGYGGEKVQSAVFATIDRELEKLPREERTIYRDEISNTVEKVIAMHDWIEGLRTLCGNWFIEGKKIEVMKKAVDSQFKQREEHVPVAVREAFTKKKDEMMQKIEKACEVTRGEGGGLNEFFENYAKSL
jgi:hypothetical protein